MSELFNMKKSQSLQPRNWNLGFTIGVFPGQIPKSEFIIQCQDMFLKFLVFRFSSVFFRLLDCCRSSRRLFAASKMSGHRSGRRYVLLLALLAVKCPSFVQQHHKRPRVPVHLSRSFLVQICFVGPDGDHL